MDIGKKVAARLTTAKSCKLTERFGGINAFFAAAHDFRAVIIHRMREIYFCRVIGDSPIAFIAVVEVWALLGRGVQRVFCA